MNLDSLIEAKRQGSAFLLSRQNVVACGVGFKIKDGQMTDEPCVVVSVSKKVPEVQLDSSHIVPRTMGRVKTDVQETGIIRVLLDHTARHRPAPGGVSIGHIDVTAGTLGCLVERGSELFILSNNHVLANCGAGYIGDPILQPGPHDGGLLTDCIAHLEDFVPIDFGTSSPTCPMAIGVVNLLNRLFELLGSNHRLVAFCQTSAPNRVDAAIARPISREIVEKQILEIGVPRGVGEATLGTKIKKSGRTTSLTSGTITQIDVTCSVSYGEGRVALFDDQLMAGAISQGGDSGSVVLDEEGFVVGLLFAGSDTTTIINPIQFVLDELGIRIATEAI